MKSLSAPFDFALRAPLRVNGGGLALVLAFTASLTAHAQIVCDQPRPRDTAPLLKSIQEDDSMASAFDVTSGACVSESAACDAQKLKCNDQLTSTLQRQVNVDNGMWLRDMLLPFNAQRYTMVTAIATTEVAQDVSCNSDAPSLKAAALRRRQLAQRRRDIVNEYPKWAMWAAGVAQKCKIDSAAANKASADAAAAAKAQADAALAAKTAEELRQDNARKAEQAAKDKIEADRRAKEDAVKAETDRIRKQQEAQAELMRKQQEAQAEMLRKEREARMTEAERAVEAAKRAEEEKKRAIEEAARKVKEEEERKKREAKEEEDRKKREALALAEAKLVQDRESRKTTAEKNADALRAQEEARRLAAEKQIAAAEQIDRSDERLKGSLSAHLQGAYMSLASTNAGGLMGVAIAARYGIWMTAPAQGMTSGMELKVNGQFLGLIAGQGGAQYFAVAPELRWFFARFGVGLTFEYRRLVTPLPTTDPKDTFALGINLALAIADTPDGRFILVVRWMPFINAGTDFAYDRITAEAEIGYKWFSASLQAGTVALRNSGALNLGWYAGLGLGGRLRF